MNKFAFRTTGLLIKALYNLSKARLDLHDPEHIPEGPTIFVVNHFTRLETFLFPYVIYTQTKKPVWSLAAAELFRGAFGDYLEKVGAVSNKAPNRDSLIVSSLLTGDANWIIFPEGRMVKSKKIFEKGKFLVSYAGGKHPPHTGAATLALRTEFYRRRILELFTAKNPEAERLMALFKIDDIDRIRNRRVSIVPVNISYYPLRAKENFLSKLAVSLVEDLPDRLLEEIMTEGAMLLSGVDIDIRFGEPIEIQPRLDCSCINQDICRSESFNFDDPIRSKKRMRREALKIMQAYMSAIYGMSTVNHDHLFASILRMSRRREFDEMDLRRRVYLAATGAHEKNRIYRHRSLFEDQISLITDDRYHRYRDFIELAIEKDIVSRENGRIKKTVSKFSSPLDFNRIRIDNPIAVMANDIEPLTDLQRRLRRLSLKSSRWIRRQLAGALVKQELTQFEDDYRRFYRSDTSKAKDIGRPFLIEGRSRDTGILLIHGYLSAPAEIRPLAQYLGRLGFWVYGVRLTGHGTSPEDLSGKTYQDWIQSADTGYGIISSLCNRVVLGGFSAGGGLALELATRLSDIAGVFSVCPPMRLRNPLAKLAPGIDAVNRSLQKVRAGGLSRNYIEHHPENPDINYTQNPISGVKELERLMQLLHPRLSDIRTPALVIQSADDPLVDPRGSEDIVKNISSLDKTYIPVDFERHGILLGSKSVTVHQIIGDFIQRI